jgi:tetratricopeptide (TPR) repeat protein
MRTRTFLFSLIVVALLLAFMLPAHALFENDVDKAKDFMKAGMYPQAIQLLDKRIQMKPTDAEAHFQLGICYIHTGNFRGADERFASAVRLKSEYGYKIGAEYKKAADSAQAKGDLGRSQTLYEQGIKYDPALKKGAYDYFFQLGNKSNPNNAATFYDKALQYSEGNKEREQKVGLKYLKLAALQYPGGQCESLKAKAARIVGEEKVSEVFPPAYMKVTFEKTYTFDDSFNEYGQIETIRYGVDDVKVGDKIEVIGKLKGSNTFSGQEIAIYRGKNFDPEWETTKNGYLSQPVEFLPVGKTYGISLGGRKDVQVTIRVTRHTTPKPNLDLVKNY